MIFFFQILQQIWPNANYYAKDLVREVIEPKIAEALSEYKLPGFKFDRILLGTIPPRLGGVKVYDKNTSRNEIILDADLFYASDCDINFQLAGMRAGIKDFQIHGMVRVIMKPLISKIPLVGGLQVFFLNNPDIDFNLVRIIFSKCKNDIFRKSEGLQKQIRIFSGWCSRFIGYAGLERHASPYYSRTDRSNNGVAK